MQGKVTVCTVLIYIVNKSIMVCLRIEVTYLANN